MLAPARPRPPGPQQPGQQAARPTSLEVRVVVALTALGAILRFSTLHAQSLWFDEAQLAHEVRLSLGGLFHTLGKQETSPPLYFLAAWLWSKLLGTGDVALRSLSALLGTAVIPVSYLCGREFVSRRAGAVAAALVALSPFMIWYSQEAREYMLLALTCAGSLLFFARAWNRRERRDFIWWGVLSALALLTHFYAGFLVAPEALLLLWRTRRRACVVAVLGVAAVQLALLPLAIADTAHPIGWIKAVPLSTRIQQVPVAFALNTLYKSSLVNYGILGAAIVLAVVILLLVGGAGARELRGAALAGGLAAAVVLLPLLAALGGHDYYISRALIPALVPLAVVIGAACTAVRLRGAGTAFAVVVLAALVFAGVKIAQNPQYQRPDWRGVARLLGTSRSTRAIVALDGSLATDPLALYLPRVPSSQPRGAVSVSEVDVVAGAYETPAPRLPAGVRLLGRGGANGFSVARFSVSPDWLGTPEQISSRAGTLMSAAAAAPAVLIEQGIA